MHAKMYVNIEDQGPKSFWNETGMTWNRFMGDLKRHVVDNWRIPLQRYSHISLPPHWHWHYFALPCPFMALLCCTSVEYCSFYWSYPSSRNLPGIQPCETGSWIHMCQIIWLLKNYIASSLYSSGDMDHTAAHLFKFPTSLDINLLD